MVSITQSYTACCHTSDHLRVQPGSNTKHENEAYHRLLLHRCVVPAIPPEAAAAAAMTSIPAAAVIAAAAATAAAAAAAVMAVPGVAAVCSQH